MLDNLEECEYNCKYFRVWKYADGIWRNTQVAEEAPLLRV